MIGTDGAYWKNKDGKSFNFSHFLDEGTLFHLGKRSHRSVETQIETFEDTWLSSAGASKEIYLDPAGEFVSPKWLSMSQREDIKIGMTATESHWQIGRVESHGKISKTVLTKMEREQPIVTEEDFDICLRHCFNAKKSLCRANGFTPEMAVLGKLQKLPASLTSDRSLSAHSLADSETPEGMTFRQNLARREAARRAFISADNDRNLKRALVRRSRPARQEYQSKEWVMYWRNRRVAHGELGRWHGPAQVVVQEGVKVVWVSHGGPLLRCSPEQLRPLYLRECTSLPRDQNGNIDGENRDWKSKLSEVGSFGFQFVDNITTPGPPPSTPGSPHISSSSQPDQEPAPPLSEPEEGENESSPIPANDSELNGINIPIPSNDDSETALVFGDDVNFETKDNFHAGTDQIYSLEIPIYDSDIQHSKEAEDPYDYSFIASAAKKGRSEVKIKDLTVREKKLIDQAKAKEVSSWLGNSTAKRILRRKLSAERILRCRWILTWKAPDVAGGDTKAKARVVVLGFEDPDLATIPNDAPTLSKDGRTMVLQKIASNKWRLTSCDISTAFLRGKGDGRMLGMEPPQELRDAMQLKEDEVCQLVGGAYGRIDAPYFCGTRNCFGC